MSTGPANIRKLVREASGRGAGSGDFRRTVPADTAGRIKEGAVTGWERSAVRVEEKSPVEGTGAVPDGNTAVGKLEDPGSKLRARVTVPMEPEKRSWTVSKERLIQLCSRPADGETTPASGVEKSKI